MSGFASWWDSAELWLAGLPFVPQVALVLVVVVPAAAAIAVGLDHVVAAVLGVLGRAGMLHRAAGSEER
jgi:hypothetical protein